MLTTEEIIWREQKNTISPEEEHFRQLQETFKGQYLEMFSNKLAEKTIVIIPSLTLDEEILSKIRGAHYYEERMLCMLMLLKMPNTQIIYITSMPIDPIIVDYYLHLLPGITGYHARQRLTLLSCYDSSKRSLTEKILERPRLIEKIKHKIPKSKLVHLSCFNVTNAERNLAIQLNAPIYGCDPSLLYLGTKSSSRKLFKECGIDLPQGFEDVRTEEDIIHALVKLKQAKQDLKKAVIKINDGFSGEGNAVFSFADAPTDGLKEWITNNLPTRIKIVAGNVGYQDFIKKFIKLEGIVEAFIEGEIKTTPSVQCRINPLGKIDIISTHDQITGGESGQVFLGALFPANKEYAVEIGKLGHKISEKLKQHGVLGRFSIDFISVKEETGWKNYAIEINLRKGGTTHPYLMLQFLTDGKYDAETGIYHTINNEPRYYICSDNLQSDSYKGLVPSDLIDIAMCNDLLFNGYSQEGVMFHLISTLSQYGKIGVVCIGSSPENAEMYYQKTISVLNKECGK